MVAIGCGMDEYIVLKPEFRGRRGATACKGGLSELVWALPVSPPCICKWEKCWAYAIYCFHIWYVLLSVHWRIQPGYCCCCQRELLMLPLKRRILRFRASNCSPLYHWPDRCLRRDYLCLRGCCCHRLHYRRSVVGCAAFPLDAIWRVGSKTKPN